MSPSYGADVFRVDVFWFALNGGNLNDFYGRDRQPGGRQVGEPAMQYLTESRMQLTRTHLQQTSEPLAPGGLTWARVQGRAWETMALRAEKVREIAPPRRLPRGPSPLAPMLTFRPNNRDPRTMSAI
ncbi:hypothetical protein WMF28_16580 [Sorangium sp. So ce590]|uniref:hypothetical protein n=1 Tax=Sorangium sp. So ce590 TaxID=3133317 RepID=UPI003F5FE37E